MNGIEEEQEWQMALENPWPEVRWRRLNWTRARIKMGRKRIAKAGRLVYAMFRTPELVRQVAPGVPAERLERQGIDALRGGNPWR